MRFKWVSLFCVAVFALMAGCTPQSVKPGQTDQLVRGTLSKEGEGYRFSACGMSEVLDAELASDLLKREHLAQSIGEGWPVYVEALGNIGKGSVVLVQPLVVGGSLSACEYNLPGIELRAVAEDGSVVVDLREQHLRVQYPGRMLLLSFDRPEVNRMALERRWQQTLPAGGGRKEHEFSLKVVPEPCRGTSGAWYALGMNAKVNGVQYRGCARLGDLGHWPLRIRYATADSITTRRLSVSFERDGRFRLVEDYLNEQPVIEYSGRWQRLSSERVRLFPDDQQLAPITFQIGTGGHLRLQGFHPAYGRSLELNPAGPVLRVSSGELDWWR